MAKIWLKLQTQSLPLLRAHIFEITGGPGNLNCRMQIAIESATTKNVKCPS
jgi:hypothetical protein